MARFWLRARTTDELRATGVGHVAAGGLADKLGPGKEKIAVAGETTRAPHVKPI